MSSVISLKEFFIETSKLLSNDGEQFVSIEDLGLFFWERGGKQFVIECRKIYWNHKDRKNHYPSFDFLVCEAEKPLVANMFKDAQDFLDCVACLGEDKVKELIKELK